jgi:hypothetical protein
MFLIKATLERFPIENFLENSVDEQEVALLICPDMSKKGSLIVVISHGADALTGLPHSIVLLMRKELLWEPS